MRIVVLLDRARLFRWHLVLIEALQSAGHGAIAQFRDTAEALPTSLSAILDFDRVRTRAGPDRFSTHIQAEAFQSFRIPPGAKADLTIDLSTASFEAATSGRRLAPLYDGSPKDHALFHALLNGEAPRLSVADTGADSSWIIGWPALEQPARFAPSLDQTASRLLEGLLRIVNGIAAGVKPTPQYFSAAADRRPSSILSSAGRFAASRGTRKLMQARDKMSGDEPKWHVAWRKLDVMAPPQPGLLDFAAFRLLPDDGNRFYADPFVFVHDRTTHVFVEELPEATGRGIISHFTFDAAGNATEPRPVLEAAHHLSYPFVFARDGAIWMLPEASQGGGLDLYRATQFPDRWEKVARLIDTPLHDATLFSHSGFLWIAAATTAFQSSSWDSLSLYWAETLLGPWHPHTRNPVLIDATAARPAGAVWEAGAELYRPAQDCSEAYGGKITIRRIVRLYPEQFEEETVGTLSFAQSPDVLGPHTLSRGGGYELVDLYARPRAISDQTRSLSRSSDRIKLL